MHGEFGIEIGLQDSENHCGWFACELSTLTVTFTFDMVVLNNEHAPGMKAVNDEYSSEWDQSA